jgi:hypothetical protein
MERMELRGSSSQSTRLRQVRDELRGVRPRASRRDADSMRLQDAWPPEVRRRRLVDQIERELESTEDDASQ